MLARRLRRRASIDPASGERFVIAGYLFEGLSCVKEESKVPPQRKHQQPGGKQL